MQPQLLPLLLLLLVYGALPLVLLHLLLRAFHIRRRPTNNHSSPPSPWKLPFLGNLHQLGPLVHQSLHRLAKTHGPVMLLHLGSTPTLVVSSPAAARDVTNTHDLVFANRPSLVAADRIFYGRRDMVFAPYGDYWRQMRKLCTLHLLSSKMVHSFQGVREEEVADMVSTIARGCQEEGVVNLSEILHSLANAVMCRVALGRRCSAMESGRRRELCETINEMSALLGELQAEDLFPRIGFLWSIVSGTRSRFRRCSEKIDALLVRAIEDHRGGGGGDSMDFVDVLLRLQKDGSNGIHLGEDNVKAILLDMLAAGTDTSFITLEWIMAELIRNPRALSRAQEEIRRCVAGEKAFPPSETTIAQLEYMDAVIKETLRLHPPAPLLLPREATSEAQVQGFAVPAGTRVLVNVWSMGRDPNLWEDPEAFEPQRFLNSGIDFKGQQDHGYMPFGSGRRECPGLTFATHLVRMALFHLLHRFDWEARPDLDMEEVFGLGTHRKNPLLATARPR